MKNLFKNLFVVLSCITLFLSCSKGDDSPTDNPVGGDAYRMQIMTIDLPNTSLPNSEYHGSMGNTEIILTKGDEHKLLFMIPSTMELGNQDLVINDLNNMNITYNVKDVVLPDTADTIVSPFQNNLATFQATIPSDVSIQKAIDSFNQVYANSTEEEKNNIARLYYVNKAAFDDVILNDYSNVSGKFYTPACMNNLFKHKASVLAVGIGLVTMYAGQKVIGAVIVTVGLLKAKTFWGNFFDCKLNTISLKLNSILGINNKLDGSIQLQDNTPQILNFDSVDRTIISSDSDKQSFGMKLCFEYHELYNTFAGQTNTVIQWINNNVPFTNFDLIPLEVVPATSDLVNNPIDSNSYSHLSLSINDSNLTLVSSTLSSSGQLSLKVKINGNATTVNSTMNYSYSDDFNTFTGSFPITVSVNNIETVTIGTQVWMLRNLNVDHYRNGDPIPQVTDPAQWANLTTGAWCYISSDPANGPTYGKHYNWYAVNDPRGLAPQGYHVPTDTEWTVLTDYLGGEAVAGGALKATTTLWTSPNTGATNSSGFTGLPLGIRWDTGDFNYFNDWGVWWSSSANDTSSAWYRSLQYNDANVYKGSSNEKNGFSVRCLKD